jgi:hypothetical protein
VYDRDGLFIVQPGDDLLHWVAINDQTIARCFAEGLKLQTKESLSRNVMVGIPIPTPAALKSWQKTVAEFDAKNYEQSLDGTLDKLDQVVAKAFKIPVEEVAFIKSEFQADPMLRRVRPNSPTATSSASARASLLPTATRRRTRRGVSWRRAQGAG